MQKKKPSDYPKMTFRISAEDKERIYQLVNEAVEVSSQTLSDNDKAVRKNEVFVDALYLGLLTMKKKGFRLTRG